MNAEEEAEEWHPQPTNWWAIAAIIIALAILVIIVVGTVEMMSHVPSSPATTVSLQTPTPCSECH